MQTAVPLVTNDAVVLGILASILGFVFWSSSRADGFWKKFYTYVPALLLCYLVPAILNTLGIIDGSLSRLYPVARDYLLPSALVLLCIAIDFGAIVRLGPKAIIMFLTGTVGIMLGAVAAFEIMRVIHPETVAGETWRGMTTITGAWIGGGANMLAMKEIFEVDATTFGQFAVVDVGVGYVWMAVLIFFASRAPALDRRSGADTTALDDLRDRVASYQAQHARIPALGDLMVMAGVAFGAVAISHAVAGPLSAWFAAHVGWSASVSLDKPFVWVVLLATLIGLGLSFTRARELEGVGASKWGSMFLYFLIACIGMQMDLLALLEKPWLFALGVLWIGVHIVLLWLAGKLLRVPFFYFAIASQSNIGGPASAPVLASAFHPALAPVGVLLGTLGYAVGTGAAYVVGITLRAMAGAG